MKTTTLLVSACIFTALGVNHVEVREHDETSKSHFLRIEKDKQAVDRDTGTEIYMQVHKKNAAEPAQSAALSAAGVKIGSEAQNNHGSAHNAPFVQWLRHFQRPAKPMKVLDVGGGNGQLHQNLRDEWPADSFTYDCIDVHASGRCKQYNGQSLPYEDNSKDLVVFKYVLHHAADNTLGLLREASRVSNGLVVVCEDLKGETEAEAKRNEVHDWHGTFRGASEWEQLFGMLGFRIVQSTQITPQPGYSGNDVQEKLGRRMWVLSHDQVKSLA